MVDPIAKTGLKIASVAACSWCIENFEKEPIFCGIVCSIGAVVGIKVSYESAKIIHKNLEPFIKSALLESKKLAE